MLVSAEAELPPGGPALISEFTMTATLTGHCGWPREPESVDSRDQYGGNVTRHARIVELSVKLPSSGAPLRHRVADALIDLLRTGHLRPGDALPSTRALAAELAISRTAVLAAYDELAAAGFIQAAAGSSTVVAAGADLAARAGVSSHIPPPQPAPDTPYDTRPVPGGTCCPATQTPA